MREPSGMTLTQTDARTPLRGHFDEVSRAIAAASRNSLVPREARLALLALCGLLDGMVDRIERLEQFERREHWRNG